MTGAFNPSGAHNDLIWVRSTVLIHLDENKRMFVGNEFYTINTEDENFRKVVEICVSKSVVYGKFFLL